MQLDWEQIITAFFSLKFAKKILLLFGGNLPVVSCLQSQQNFCICWDWINLCQLRTPTVRKQHFSVGKRRRSKQQKVVLIGSPRHHAQKCVVENGCFETISTLSESIIWNYLKIPNVTFCVQVSQWVLSTAWRTKKEWVWDSKEIDSIKLKKNTPHGWHPCFVLWHFSSNSIERIRITIGFNASAGHVRKGRHFCTPAQASVIVAQGRKTSNKGKTREQNWTHLTSNTTRKLQHTAKIKITLWGVHDQ